MIFSEGIDQKLTNKDLEFDIHTNIYTLKILKFEHQAYKKTLKTIIKTSLLSIRKSVKRFRCSEAAQKQRACWRSQSSIRTCHERSQSSSTLSATAFVTWPRATLKSTRSGRLSRPSTRRLLRLRQNHKTSKLCQKNLQILILPLLKRENSTIATMTTIISHPNSTGSKKSNEYVSKRTRLASIQGNQRKKQTYINSFLRFIYF